jgi:hypothetical protein
MSTVVSLQGRHINGVAPLREKAHVKHIEQFSEFMKIAK